MSAPDLFMNACRIHTDFAIGRYLMSVTTGRLNGAEKAERHEELCQFYVAAVRGVVDPDMVRRNYEDDWDRVHTATQELTDYLDEVIGFPLDDEHPDYEVFIPLFFQRFHTLALLALNV